jgi:hypothetical protein
VINAVWGPSDNVIFFTVCLYFAVSLATIIYDTYQTLRLAKEVDLVKDFYTRNGIDLQADDPEV